MALSRTDDGALVTALQAARERLDAYVWRCVGLALEHDRDEFDPAHLRTLEDDLIQAARRPAAEPF